MNTVVLSPKKLFPVSLLVGIGMMILIPGIATATPSHDQVKADMSKASQISIEQAIQAATKEVPGRVIKAELEKEHGPLMWEIEIVTSEGKVQEVHLDGVSGKRLALQNSEGTQEGSESSIHTGSAEQGSQKMEK